MARRRFEQLSLQRRTEILSVAAEEFAKSGFQRTSYNQLLARVGLGKSSAYYYFEDKQDLFLTVVKHCYRSFFESVSNLPRATSVSGYWDYIEALNLRGFEFMQTDPTSAAVLQCFSRELTTLDLLSSAELLESLERYYVDLAKLGQKLGAVRRDLPFDLIVGIARALASAFDQWFIKNALHAKPPRFKVYARQFTELSRRLLQPETGTEEERRGTSPRRTPTADRDSRRR